MREAVAANHWPKRLYALDVSRGLAALAVVVWHWEHFAFEGHAAPDDYRRADQPFYGPLKLFYEEGRLGVDYFFLLSGFIFFWLYREALRSRAISIGKFVIQRFSRLYPLHLATLLIVAFLQFLYHNLSGTSFVYSHNDPFHFLLHLGFASNWGAETGWSFNAPVWSVSIEILLYAGFVLTVLFLRGGWLVALIISLGSFVALYKLHHPVFRGASSFYLGGVVYYATYAMSARQTRWKGVIYGATALTWCAVLIDCYLLDLGGGIASMGSVGGRFMKAFPYYILFTLTVSTLVLYEIDHGVEPLKPVAWIGDITYSSYLIHFPLQILFALAVAQGVLGQGFYTHPVAFVVFFVILVPLSYLTYHRFERPVQRAIRQRVMSV